MRVSKQIVLYGAFVTLFLLFSLTAPNFASARNLVAMASQFPEVAILAIAMMLSILTAGIDLSLTYLAALAGIGTAYALAVWGVPIAAAVAVALCIGVLGGALNAFVIGLIGVPPILVTLGTMMLFRGIGLRVTKGGSVAGLPDAYGVIAYGKVLGVPVSFLIFLVVASITALLLNYTAWGRYVYMVGSNRTATEFSGINTRRVLVSVYVYGAALAAVASVIMSSRYNSARIDYGASYLMLTISAVVLGGTQIYGGVGRVEGVIAGVAIFQILSSALNLYGVSPHVTQLVMGALLIAVLVVDYLSRAYESRRSTAAAGLISENRAGSKGG